MEYDRPFVMSIAGLDPSGGAGILADIKTFEQHYCIGFGVATALTIQTEDQFFRLSWLSLEQIQAQAAPLLKRYRPAVIKIGIMETISVLADLVVWLKLELPEVKLIWDPVVSASSGFSFLHDPDHCKLKTILEHLFLLCPNVAEACFLTGNCDEQQAAEELARYCNVLLKGGHSLIHQGTDILYMGTNLISITGHDRKLPQKHGSGCILSSSITAYIACGEGLKLACIKAKEYIEKTLISNPNLLAYHV